MKCLWNSKCTCFVDSWFGTYIGECCAKHDAAYETQTNSKEVADRELYECIKSRTNRVLASVMWGAVRIGGYYTSWNDIKKGKK